VTLVGQDRRFFEPSPGTIVVAAALDAGCLPFLANAAAIVVEQGGILSHVAILARHLAIPAVVAERITNVLVEGEMIRVDADRGLIELADRPA
jgi:phosphohistidine swiveling domain-containing protein